VSGRERKVEELVNLSTLH